MSKIITIGRQYGSGGRALGKMIAEKLNIPLYDKELVELAAKKSNVSLEAVKEIDERASSSLLYSIVTGGWGAKGLNVPLFYEMPLNDKLFIAQAKVIKELAAKESFVIAGRCADFVLKDNPNVIRVFVHAPLEHCIDVVAPMKNMSRKEAEKFILKKDKYRGEYYYHYTGKNWNDARNYDICLNSSELNYDKCIEIIKNYMEVRFK